MTQQRRSTGARGAGTRAVAGASGAGRTRGRPTSGGVGATRFGGARAGTTRQPPGAGAAPGAATSRAGAGPKGPARPSVRRSGAGHGGAKRTRAPQSGALTTRAAVLAVVMLVLLAAYAYPLRVYLAQQAEIADIEAQQSAQLHKIDELTEQRAKWDDDAYIMSQARRRLQYYLPGETPFAVIGGSDPEQPAPGDEPAPKPPADPPWYGKLWSSIEAANRR